MWVFFILRKNKVFFPNHLHDTLPRPHTEIKRKIHVVKKKEKTVNIRLTLEKTYIAWKSRSSLLRYSSLHKLYPDICVREFIKFCINSSSSSSPVSLWQLMLLSTSGSYKTWAMRWRLVLVASHSTLVKPETSADRVLDNTCCSTWPN